MIDYVISTVQRVRLVSEKSAAVIAIATLLHNDVDHAAQRAAVLRFNAGSLHLNFLNELERYIGVGVAAGNIFSVLSFYEIAALGIRGTAN